MNGPLKKTFDCPPVPRLKGDKALFKDGKLVGVQLEGYWREPDPRSVESTEG
jgi:hypothetical protein